MHHAILDRRPHREVADQGFVGSLGLTPGRVHEFCGPARVTAALWLAQRMEGPVFWIRAGWEQTRVHGPGMARFIDPGRVVFVDTPRVTDLLWTMEEVLRSGGVPLVVGDMPGAPGLTPMRRMQLACEVGGGRMVGLVLTPEGCAPGGESRWRITCDHAKGREGWRVQRERDRHAPPGTWSVTAQGDTFRVENSVPNTI